MRERAESPGAAQQRYLKFLQPALSCVTEARWVPEPAKSELRSLQTSERPMILKRRRGLSYVYFQAAQTFRLVEDERHEGEWKVETLSYAYNIKVRPQKLKEGESPDVIMWHWHPHRSPEHPSPHAHPPTTHRLFGLKLPDLHVPTGRVSFEEVVRFLIEEVKVLPLEKNWPKVLSLTEKHFKLHRTWA